MRIMYVEYELFDLGRYSYCRIVWVGDNQKKYLIIPEIHDMSEYHYIVNHIQKQYIKK